MMRRIRIAVCVIFVASCAIFGVYMYQTRMVEDHTAPVISLEEDVVTVSVDAEDAEILKGVPALDDKDGDITGSVRISSMSHFIEKGKRYVTYIVFDQANQAGTAQRTLVYTDYHSPRIYLKDPLRFSLNEVSSGNPSLDLTAEDCLDGDITNQVRTTFDTNYYDMLPGDYSVTVQVSNSAGDVCSIPLKMTLVDPSDREESRKLYPMLEDYIVYTAVGESLDLNAYVTGMMRGSQAYSMEEAQLYLNVGTEDLEISSNVNYEQPGVYTVEYSCTAGGTQGDEGTTETDAVTAVTRLYVVVEE